MCFLICLFFWGGGYKYLENFYYVYGILYFIFFLLVFRIEVLYDDLIKIVFKNDNI